MANEQLFTDRAENYRKARPGYAEGAIELLLWEILKPGDKIADIGSGTGIFAKYFIEHGFDVYCVEPNAQMRGKAIQTFEGNPHFISVAAAAEATALPDDSVELVTAASALHWFDAESFKTECKRILKPGGIFFAVLNSRKYSDAFTRRQHQLCLEFCPNFTSLSHGMEESLPRLKILFGEKYQQREFDFPLAYTKERFIQRSLSSSYAPEPGSEKEERYIEALRELMEEFFPDSGSITIPNVTMAFWGNPSGIKNEP